MPSDAPSRFTRPQVLQAGTFGDWEEVSSVFAPLYKTEGTIAPGSPLAAEVARIKAASSDPLERAVMATRLVQERISYLMNGMSGGNYVPQAPARTAKAGSANGDTKRAPRGGVPPRRDGSGS